MKILAITLLQAASATAPAQQPTGSGWSFWIMIILMFVIMWLFMIRPQRKQQKELEAFRNSLKKGDKVVTAGGIYGTVAEINDKSALIKIDGEVKIKVDKASLLRDYTQDAPQQ